MLKKLFIISTFVLSLSAFAGEKEPVFNSPKNAIVVTQKEPVFTITLQSNPTTGFSWNLISYDKNLVELLNHKYVAPENKKLMGAPGYEIWVFKAKKATYAVNQVGHVVMSYARPWTKEGATKESFMIIVKKD